ncbi:SigB/SigF/SigG family RNA polymerase sigma factor [Streptomyces sp. NPDC003077]|uniref:SigB/SigF/SigG family RNA polymerase sigma factor n=1 Tax=Streptomyces sp. NPDC003077 TaxID=3154443 RepID=UPI00339F833C
MTTTIAPAVNRWRGSDEIPETEAAFQRLAGLPDGPERRRLREELTCAWLPLAQRLALRFRDRGESLDDLKQVAALGLVKAVDHYDPERGDAFASYAVPTVVGEIKRHFRDHTWGVHVPRRVQELRAKVRLSVKELATTADDRAPSVGAIAAHSGLSEEDVLLGLEALESYRSLSLEAERPGSDDGFSLYGSLGEPEPAYETVTEREAVKTYMRRLPERERRILYLRFFCDMTQSSIGEELGLSQMHVCRIIRRTCDQIREQVEAPAETETDDSRRPAAV